MKFHLKHIWLALAAYGVWFAIFSGIEEAVHGKYWKVIGSLFLGILFFIVFENKVESK